MLCNNKTEGNASKCREETYKINWLTKKENHFRGFIELRPLKACQTYSLEMTPIRAKPGMQNQVISNSGFNLSAVRTTSCKQGSKSHHNIGAKNPNGLELTIGKEMRKLPLFLKDRDELHT